MVSDIPASCEELASPSTLDFAISLFIATGILISYLPQHAKIILRGSSKGLAPLFVLLGTVSSTAALANILTRPETRTYFGCCAAVGSFACFNSFLGIVQVFIQWVCFGLIMVLFLIFFPKEEEEAEVEHALPTWKEALLVLYISTVFFIAVFIASVFFETRYLNQLLSWANFLGTIGTTLAVIQYLPQIRTTWKLQNVESLSIPMMCIQTPGSFVWAGSLFARLGAGGWSTWGLFLVTGCLQGIILTMGISFTVRDWKKAKGKAISQENGRHAAGEFENDESTPPVDERAPLIPKNSTVQQSV